MPSAQAESAGAANSPVAAQAAPNPPAAPATAPTTAAPALPSNTIIDVTGKQVPFTEFAPIPVANGPGLTIEEAVNYAILHDPQIAGAAAELRAARAVVTQRRAVRRPQGGFESVITRQGPVVNSPTPGENPLVPGWVYNNAFSASQVIIDFGQRLHRQREAERQTQSAISTLAETQNNIRFVIATAFYNIVRAEGLIRTGNRRLENAREQLRVSEARYKADVAPRYDVLTAQAQLADAEQQLLLAQDLREQSVTALNTAMGRDADIPMEVHYNAHRADLDVPFAAARDAAARNRPQLEALRQTVAASEQEVKARRAENKPQIVATGSYNRPNPGGFASTEFRYGIGLALTWPFLDSGLTRGRVREAQALTDVDRQNLETARQQAEQDIQQALLDIRSTRARVISAMSQVSAAQEALRVADVRYRAGVGTILEETTAQLALSSAGGNLANSQMDYETAVARLEFATGATIDSLLHPPAAPVVPGTSQMPATERERR